MTHKGTQMDQQQGEDNKGLKYTLENQGWETAGRNRS